MPTHKPKVSLSFCLNNFHSRNYCEAKLQISFQQHNNFKKIVWTIDKNFLN